MVKDEKRIKIAVIAGASSALKYKERNPRATEQEILQHITSEANLILSKIDDGLKSIGQAMENGYSLSENDYLSLLLPITKFFIIFIMI